jgi:hypothetical protein
MVLVALIAVVMVMSCFGAVGVRGASIAASGVINDFESPLSVVKLKGNAESSQVLRGWICPTIECQWHQWVENSGLKALVVDIYEGQASQGSIVFSTRIVFADYGAYPSGTVQLPDFQPAYQHLYNIVLTPVGHKDSQALYFHESTGKYAPVPRCTITTLDRITYQFDASQSYDPDGSIVSYVWNWSDGTSSIGPIAVHSFGLSGSWSLTVTDNDGLEGRMFGHIGIW